MTVTVTWSHAVMSAAHSVQLPSMPCHPPQLLPLRYLPAHAAFWSTAVVGTASADLQLKCPPSSPAKQQYENNFPAKQPTAPHEHANVFNSRHRAQVLTSLSSCGDDNSRKGSVDVLAAPVCSLLNAHSDYVTTSSCSGRVCVFESGRKSGCRSAPPPPHPLSPNNPSSPS